MANRKKGKRRNSEKRKEKSRDAARSRRTKECEIFNDLADQLPVASSQLQQLDKASIIRLAISHLKLRRLLAKDKNLQHTDELQRKLDLQYEKALEGFVLVIAGEGDIMFLSENVSRYLGITQIELLGQSIYDFTHPCDHEEIHEILLEKSGKGADKANEDCNFLIRMKCTLTSKGRNINLKSANYKVVSCSGRYVSVGSKSEKFCSLNEEHKTSMILIAEPIPHPSNIEVPLDKHTFVSRHSLDMRFTHCDDRVYDLLGYKSQMLINESLFDYHHAMDSKNIKEACKDLFCKGQSVMTNYRFLAYGGGYCRIRTEATIINNQRTDRPQHIVCVNYLISGLENQDIIMSPVQHPCKVTPDIPVLPSGIMLSTESVFAPRPKDADDDMLQITDVNGKMQMLNDLLELAPSAGTVHMNFDDNGMNETYVEDLPPEPIEDYTDPPMSKMFSTTDMKVLDLSYLRDGSVELDSSRSSCNVNSKKTVHTYTTTPETRTTEPYPSKPESRLMEPYPATTQTGVTDNMDEMDFDMRAPFITMDGSDDQLFGDNWVPLVDEDMFNSRMIGITESVFEPRPPEPKEVPNTHNKTPLSILRLQASQNIPMPGGEIARNAGPPKMKRPMETNRLETGPPKHTRLATLAIDDPAITSNNTNGSNTIACIPTIQDIMKDTPCTRSNSVLMNLLTKGEDTNFGYRVPVPKSLGEMFKNDRSGLKSLLIVTSSDEESDVIDLDDESDDDSGGATTLEIPELTELNKAQQIIPVVTVTKKPAYIQMAATTATVTGMTNQPTTKTALTSQPANATVTAMTSQPPSRANLVVVRTNNTVLFAPIPVAGGRPQIVGVKYN